MDTAPLPALSAGLLARSDSETTMLSLDRHRLIHNQEYHTCVYAISSLVHCNDLNKVSIITKKTMKIKVSEVKVKFNSVGFVCIGSSAWSLLGPACIPWSELNIM